MKTKFMLLIVFVGIVTSAVFSARMVRAQGEPRRIEVTAKRFGYDPGEITVKKGQPVVLVIKSADVDHGLRFRELNLNAKIDKGKSAELSFTATANCGDTTSRTARTTSSSKRARFSRLPPH